MVFAVICNTDYEYKGESTRKAHFDYRLQLVKGAVRAASIYVKWYDWTLDLKDITSGIDSYVVENTEFQIFPNPVSGSNGILNIKNLNPDIINASLEIHDAQGQRIHAEKIHQDMQINASGLLKPGVYYVSVKTPAKRKTHKLVVI